MGEWFWRYWGRGGGAEGEWARVGGSVRKPPRKPLPSRLRASRVNERPGLPFFHARLFLSLSGIRRLSWMRLRIGVMVFGEVAPRSAAFEAQGKQGKRGKRPSWEASDDFGTKAACDAWN